MKIVGTIEIPAPRHLVFDKLRDARFFASCIDGVSDLTEIDPIHYTATLTTKIAYIHFNFAIAVEIVRLEPPNMIVCRSEGKPLGMIGRIVSTSVATLSECNNGTVISYEIEMSVAGKLGSLGQPVLRSKAKDMERQLAINLSAAFAAVGSGAR